MNEESRKNFFQRNIFLILCSILCLPLFFINVKSSHDWGDDFAQYILQAKNIVEGKPQTETGYVYDKALPVIAPPAYPAGFPLMLAVVYKVKGNSIHAFNYLISLLLFLLCVTMFLFFRNHFSELTALFLVLIFAYNPWTLSFKTEILSDIPYALFFLLTTILYLRFRERNSLAHHLLIGISCGIMLSVRGVATVFVIALLLHSLYLIFKEGRNRTPIIKRTLVILGSASVFYFLLNIVFVHVPTGRFLEFYSNAYEKYSTGDIIIQNLNYYTQVFEGYFDVQPEKWIFITVISKAFSLALLLIGMTYCLLHKRTFIDLLAWIYILLFIVYPYSASGFRFILPLFPFLLYYMVIGLKQIKINIPANRKVLILSAGLFVLLQYQHAFAKILSEKKNTLTGPQETESVEMFDYIRKNVPEESVIIFKKPKALALYTERRTASTFFDQSSDDVKKMILAFHVDYLVINTDNTPGLLDLPSQKYIEENPNDFTLIWKNSKFLLYKKAVQ